MSGVAGGRRMYVWLCFRLRHGFPYRMYAAANSWLLLAFEALPHHLLRTHPPPPPRPCNVRRRAHCTPPGQQPIAAPHPQGGAGGGARTGVPRRHARAAVGQRLGRQPGPGPGRRGSQAAGARRSGQARQCRVGWRASPGQAVARCCLLGGMGWRRKCGGAESSHFTTPLTAQEKGGERVKEHLLLQQPCLQCKTSSCPPPRPAPPAMTCAPPDPRCVQPSSSGSQTRPAALRTAAVSRRVADQPLQAACGGVVFCWTCTGYR